MKKVLIGLGVLGVVVAVALVWLAGSVGPETAPQDIKTIELDADYDR